MVKGRFLSGTIGYVIADDLELYAKAFRRPLKVLNDIQEQVLDAIRQSETLTPRQIKEETGLLNKKIMPALHRLQEAFLVYEDQIDEDWERNWYDFSTEWHQINLSGEDWDTSAAQVLTRFLRNHVFATFDQLKDWSRWNTKPLKSLLSKIEQEQIILPQKVEGLGEGWVLKQDVSINSDEVQPSVFVLHKSDILVRSHYSELKRRFEGQEILQYLLIDGLFQGAVLGHWRIGPYDVDDILVELPSEDRANRREEIINAVRYFYKPPHSNILRYDGKNLS
jgi:hypothetical protein